LYKVSSIQSLADSCPKLEDPGIDVKIILKLILEKWYGEAWTGLIWLTIRTGGWLL
jgi:hypothetical protein